MKGIGSMQNQDERSVGLVVLYKMQCAVREKGKIGTIVGYNVPQA